MISIHVPLAGHDPAADIAAIADKISIHVPLAGHDRQHRQRHHPCQNFNPRAPCGARLNDADAMQVNEEFQSTCPLRGTTPRKREVHCLLRISIHVPLAGHDQLLVETLMPPITISIHVPLAGHDHYLAGVREVAVISIHVPLAGHDPQALLSVGATPKISIHVPLAGHDRRDLAISPPLEISIHVPLAGHDKIPRGGRSPPRDFNPRAPCGARLQKGTKITVHFCENRLDLRFSTGSAACQEQNRS